MKVTKRRFLTHAVGATGGAIAAHVLGLFPELGVARAAARGRPQARELWDEEADRAFARIQSSREAAEFRAYLSHEGFTGKGVRSAVAILAEDGSELGDSLVTTLRSSGRTARLVQNRKGDEARSALAIWADAEPNAVTVFICGLTCEYSFYVACAVILLLSGLPGLACFLVSFLVCFVSCKWVESVVCTPICS